MPRMEAPTGPMLENTSSTRAMVEDTTVMVAGSNTTVADTNPSTSSGKTRWNCTTG